MQQAKRDGRHALVTGAGSGIGRAIALRLAAEGARVSLLGRDRERLEESAALIRAAGGAAPVVARCDVREPAEIEHAFSAACEAAGPLAVLVANSGIGGPNEPGPADRFDELVRTNLSGTYHCLRAAEGRLEEGPRTRHLIAISSILARIGVAGYSGYCASKAGILGLVRALAVELAPRGVQVNAVCPGWVDTAMAREGLEGLARAAGTDLAGARALALQAVPRGRMSTPEEIAGLVAWLASDDASGVTGQGLDVNGGAYMH